MRTLSLRRSPGIGSGVPAVHTLLAALLYGLALVPSAPAQDPQTITCPILADTSFDSRLPHEREKGAGGATALFAAGSRQLVLLRFDVSALEGLTVQRATLRLKRVRDLLVRAGVSTVSMGGWMEGHATEFSTELAAASYAARRFHPDAAQATPWTTPGSDFSDVCFGNGGSRWASVVPRFDKATLWYEIDVPPEFVQAIAQGLQPGGLCLADDFSRQDVCSEFYSREADPDNRPQLVVQAIRKPSLVANAPANLKAQRDGLGREWLTFNAPNAIGFEVYLSESAIQGEDDRAIEAATKLETWALPAPGAEQRTLLSFHRAASHKFACVRAVEAGSLWSPLVCVALPEALTPPPQVSISTLLRFTIPDKFESPFVIDDGAGVSSDGRWIRCDQKTWWNPFKGPVTLQAGRNECVSFQVVLCGDGGNYAVTLADWQSPDGSAATVTHAMFREGYVKARLGENKFAPETAEPLAPGELIAVSSSLNVVGPATAPAGEAPTAPTIQPVWVDIQVRANASAGTWKNRVIVLRNGAAVLDMPVELEVLPVLLPNRVSFPVALSSARTPASINGIADDTDDAWAALYDYHRAAHAHRTTLNLVPYDAAGKPHAGFAPKIAGDVKDAKVALDWSEWDRRFGPLFDGSAFKDQPRAGEPVNVFTLPICEGWPTPFEPLRVAEGTPLAARYNFRTTWTEPDRTRRGGNPGANSYIRWPIESSLSDAYSTRLIGAVEQLGNHLAEKSWKATEFHLSMRNGLTVASQNSWYQFNKPRLFDDYLALAYFTKRFDAAAAAIGERAALRVRADLTCPELERGVLGGTLDLVGLDESLYERSRLVSSQPERFPHVWRTGSTFDPEFGFSGVMAEVWHAYLAGAEGIEAQAALGTAEKDDKAHSGALLLPKNAAGSPRVSLRLKVARRAQQDIEWAQLWMAPSLSAGVPRGYLLGSLGMTIAEQTKSTTQSAVSLLPLLEFPAQLDTVSLEEIRRALRAEVVRRNGR